MKVAAIGSIESGRVSTHANAGVTVGGLARELSYGGALAVAASAPVTLSGGPLGPGADSGGPIVSTAEPPPTNPAVATIRPRPGPPPPNTLTLLTRVQRNAHPT